MLLHNVHRWSAAGNSQSPPVGPRSGSIYRDCNEVAQKAECLYFRPARMTQGYGLCYIVDAAIVLEQSSMHAAESAEALKGMYST